MGHKVGSQCHGNRICFPNGYEPYGGTPGTRIKQFWKPNWSFNFAEPWFRESRAQQHARRSAVMAHMMSVMCLQVCLRQSQGTQRKQRLSLLPNQFFLSFLRARSKTIITNTKSHCDWKQKLGLKFATCRSWWQESIAAFLIWIGAILTTLRSLLQSRDRVGPWGPAIWVIWPSPIQDDPEFLLSPSPKSKISGPQRALFVGEKMHS